MSPRAVPSRAHISWRTPRECGNPAGAVRRIRVVGKQTRNSNPNILAATSFPGEWSACFVFLHHVGSLPWPPLKVASMSELRFARQTRSGVVRLLRANSNTTIGRCACKLFGFHHLPSVFRFRGIDNCWLWGYMGIHRGRPERGGLATNSSNSVPRNNEES